METIAVLVSTSRVCLWNNAIPDIVYDTIMMKSNINKRYDVKTLNRHNPIIIETFCKYYGSGLEYCNYATLKQMPYVFKNFYKIIQVPCFANSLFPESIELHVEECLSFYQNEMLRAEIKHFVRSNTNDCRYCIMYKGNLIW